MGGPFWAHKDNGAWSIIKGEFDPATEDALSAAKREFKEETSCVAPDIEYITLNTIKTSNKTIHVFAGESNFDVDKVESNTFEVEWPPKSGQRQAFPEIDRAAWFDLLIAKTKLVKSQATIIDDLEKSLLKSGAIDNSVELYGQQTLF